MLVSIERHTLRQQKARLPYLLSGPSSHQLLDVEDELELFQNIHILMPELVLYLHYSIFLCSEGLDFVIGGISQIMFALRVGRWSEKRVVYYIKSAN